MYTVSCAAPLARTESASAGLGADNTAAAWEEGMRVSARENDRRKVTVSWIGYLLLECEMIFRVWSGVALVLHPSSASQRRLLFETRKVKTHMSRAHFLLLDT